VCWEESNRLGSVFFLVVAHTLAFPSSTHNLCATVFFVAPRKSKNPIDDLGGLVGGWLGGSARALNTFLTGDRNPTFNPQTRQGIRAIQEIGNATTGGAVLAMQQGPEAVQRYMATQAALAAAGGVAPSVVRGAVVGAKAIKNPVTRQQIARRATDAAWKAKYVAEGMKPVRYSKLRDMRNQKVRLMMQMQGRVEDARDVAKWERRIADVAIANMQKKTTLMANEFSLQYQNYNPVYQRAEQRNMEKLLELYGQSGAPEGMQMSGNTGTAISKELMGAANDLFRTATEAGAEPGAFAWWQLKEDVRQAKAYQRARGIMARQAIDNIRSGGYRPANPEYVQQELQDRLEVQFLRSMMKRRDKR
jgi:hypothetical protein